MTGYDPYRPRTAVIYGRCAGINTLAACFATRHTRGRVLGEMGGRSKTAPLADHERPASWIVLVDVSRDNIYVLESSSNCYMYM